MEGWSSRRCALTWKLVGTPYNRSYFQLQVSVLPTEEIASGLLLTPTSTERCEHPDDMRARAEKNGYKNGTQYNSLTSQIVYGMLPTPRARAEGGNCSKDRGKRNLEDVISTMLPTPTTFDYNTPRSQEAWDKAKEKHGDALQNPLRQMAAFGMLPTPCASEGCKITGLENQDSLTKRTRQMTGSGSQLSPLFVGEMMGFPKNWTASPFLSGDENP